MSLIKHDLLKQRDNLNDIIYPPKSA